MLALSRAAPGSGGPVAAVGTQEGPPGLPSPSLPPRRAALEDFLPPRPPRCPPDMVGHLQLQGMDESLKEKSREGLLDSPDSGLPPSPSPPFYSLSPGEGRAGGSGGAEPPGHRREAKDGKVVRAKPGHSGLCPLRAPRGKAGRAPERGAGRREPVITARAPLDELPQQCLSPAEGTPGCPCLLQSGVGSAAAVPGRAWPSAGQGILDTLTECWQFWLGELLITVWGVKPKSEPSSPAHLRNRKV